MAVANGMRSVLNASPTLCDMLPKELDTEIPAKPRRSISRAVSSAIATSQADSDTRKSMLAGSRSEEVGFAHDSALEGDGFELVWGFSCQVVVLGFAESSLFGAGKAVLHPVACDQVPGARGRGQGTETLA